MEWENARGVNFLTSEESKTADDEWVTIPLTKPSVNETLGPEPVGPIEVKYKYIRVLAKTKNDVKEYIEDYPSILNMETDFDPLVASLRAEKVKLAKINQDRVDMEKGFFNTFVNNVADANQVSVESVKASLEAIKVFKIYPEYDAGTLFPPPSGMRGQIKHNVFNSFFGNVDGFY
jgi:hypothetical protein